MRNLLKHLGEIVAIFPESPAIRDRLQPFLLCPDGDNLTTTGYFVESLKIPRNAPALSNYAERLIVSYGCHAF
jgi:hypothetical protein